MGKPGTDKEKYFLNSGAFRPLNNQTLILYRYRKHLANIRRIFIRHDHDYRIRINQKGSNIRIRNSSKDHVIDALTL
jgi:hypothetical protein